jgi:hypothetical protein
MYQLMKEQETCITDSDSFVAIDHYLKQRNKSSKDFLFVNLKGYQLSERYLRIILDDYLGEHCSCRLKDFGRLLDPRKRKPNLTKTISSSKRFKIDKHQNQLLETGGCLRITGSRHPIP